MRALVLALVLTVACTPSSPPMKPIVVSGEGGADVCDLAAAVCQERLIRLPDGGALCEVPPGCEK